MKIFQNRTFIIDSKAKFLPQLGFKKKLEDGRIIKMKPVYIRKTDENKSQNFIMSAEISLKYPPKISKENIVFFPEFETKELGKAFSFYANLISVAEVCKVSLSSPTPSSGFIPENEKELKFLDDTKGFEHKIHLHPNFSGKFFEAIHKNQLLDRVEAVAFLATANAQKEPLGKFHEYIRLFENAFSVSKTELSELLFTFLSKNTDFDYEQDEIKNWMVETRDGATHADQRKKFVFSSDLNKDIDRIQQAAYDVLFNKAKWYDKYTSRRELLEFNQGITKKGMFYKREKKDVEITIGEDGEVFFALDEKFKEEPVEKFVAQKEWWVKYSNTDGKSFSTEPIPFEVR